MQAGSETTPSPSKAEVDDEQLIASADADEVAEQSDLLKAGKITAASKKEQAEITTLVNMWDQDTLDKNLRQGTWFTYTGNKIQWRLDNQKNGAVNIGGLFYYVLAVQAGKNVYSNVQVPYLFYLGRQRIREAFIKSMNDLATIRIVLPDKANPQPPAQSDANARNPSVAQLQWQMVKV